MGTNVYLRKRDEPVRISTSFNQVVGTIQDIHTFRPETAGHAYVTFSDTYDKKVAIKLSEIVAMCEA